LGLAEELDKCQSFSDIFEVVRKSVSQILGRHRAGLTLYLAELPTNVGAFYPVGSNAIVMNKVLLKVVDESPRSQRVKASFVYSILLHEYLHSLGYLSEGEARRLSLHIARESLGDEHAATRMCSMGPWSFFPEAMSEVGSFGGELEIVKDFDKAPRGYLA
jgi:hypothetical protein